MTKQRTKVPGSASFPKRWKQVPVGHYKRLHATRHRKHVTVSVVIADRAGTLDVSSEKQLIELRDFATSVKAMCDHLLAKLEGGG